MRLHHKNILLISPEPWTHIFVSKHHYASCLANRGNNVYFLNPPIDEYTVRDTSYERVFNVNYTGFIKGLQYFPPFLQKKVMKKVFNNLENLCGVKFDIVWSFDNSVFYDFSALPAHIFKILHIVDLNQNFQTAKAATTADICFGVIPKLVERLQVFNKNSHLIKHGVQRFPHDIERVKLPGTRILKAIYMGNLAMPFIDWELFHQIAIGNPHVNFIFIGSNHDGPKNSSKTKIKGLGNVIFLPPMDAREIPGYLASADILLLGYLPEYYNTYASPHKMMEYLASGKVICTTFIKEYKQLQKERLIAMSDKSGDFPHVFSEVVSTLDSWNAKEKQLDRKAFAGENVYPKQVDRIEALIMTNAALCS